VKNELSGGHGYCQCIYHCLSMVIMGKMAEYVVHPYNKINC